ncbi:MAG: clostripain-related cysteine peptidase [Atopobiaceae bacterium]|nr:clostripain-related cysteine peptidase [Atopobiaceae bacterium]
MLLIPFLIKPTVWVIPVIAQIIGYFFLLRRMELESIFAIVPFAAEWRLSKVLFRYRRSFWRPCVIALIFLGFAFYLNPFDGSSVAVARIYILIASLIYGFFLLRLYWRLTGTFYDGLIKRIFMTLLTWLLPPLGLLIMAFGKAEYKGAPQFKHGTAHSNVVTWLLRAGFVLVSAAEVVALVLAVGFITVRTYPPRLLADYMRNEVLTKTKDVTGTGRAVTREESMGDAYTALDTMPTTREKYFPNHSQDKSVMVLEYVIGSDLEDKFGLASANIAQMIEATKRGSGLTFVLQCGGSARWFTKGIDDGSYGRYIVHDGKLEKVADLDSNMCMSDPQNLADFINWGRDNYPADRYMLALWDHGGGLSSGYGVDQVNKRTDVKIPMLAVNEICNAIAQSGMKFDIIGFDACLMQDLDVAAALEPYADYLLASEEVEGGFGWCYTSAFGMLAENPGMPSEEFGHEMIACYDPYNTIIKDKDGEPDTESTLSFVDLPRAKAAFDQFNGFFGEAREAVRASSSSFANLSLSGTKSYTFQNDEQVDVIDFLERLGNLDYEHKICSAEEIAQLVNLVKACVVYRNGNSAAGVNGMALAFPCQYINSYSDVYKQIDSFSFTSQEELYNDFFSIMAAQKQKAMMQAAEEGDILGVLNNATDLTDQEWYVEGFENYETQDALIDIPLTEVADGYRIELPESAWGIIADSQLIVYQKAEDGKRRYMGLEDLANTDENGHPLVAMDGFWVHVGGQPVCYEPTGSRETDEGVIFTGTTKAVLNDKVTVILYIEWDPVTEGSNGPMKGSVVGYVPTGANDLLGLLSSVLGEEATGAISSKAKQTLTTGDKLDFLFDYYDEQGNLVDTSTYGSARVVKAENLEVSDERLKPCDVEFGGVLTDVYQRKMTTEKIEAHID